MDNLKWICDVCTLVNNEGVRYCSACYAINPKYQVKHPPEDDFLFAGVESAIPGEWSCPRCTYINQGPHPECAICGRIECDPVDDPDYGLFDKSARTDFEHLSLGSFCMASPSIVTEESDCDRSFLKDELRIVLIGRTGAGKSATGNSILGQDVFRSRAGGSSVTTNCKRKSAERLGRHIQVVDSPGLFDTGMTNAQTTKEIVKCIGMTSPGPHAIILVTRIDRFTKEEQDTVQHFREVFGEGMTKYLFVLFTRKDDLDAEGTDIHTFVQKVPDMLKNIISECDRRYIAFNNRLPSLERDRQVEELLKMIEDNVRRNGGRHYTNEMYREAEEAMIKRENAIREQLVEEKRRERQQIEMEFEEKLKDRTRDQQEVIDLLQSRLVHLEAEQTTSSVTEVEELRRQVADMKKQAEVERDAKRREHEERLERLERRLNDQRRNAREQARVDVEEEEESSLEEIWKGIKHVGKGVWKGLKSFFS